MHDNVSAFPPMENHMGGRWLGQDYGAIDVASWAGQEVPKRRYVLDNFVPSGLLTFLTGDGSVGKSLLMQQLCSCVASGTPFLGNAVEQGRALYVTAEDDVDELHKRHKAICATIGANDRAIAESLSLRSLVERADGVALAAWKDGYSDEYGVVSAGYRPTRLMQELEAQIRDERHRLAVLDNVSHFFTGNENERSVVAEFLRMLHGTAYRTGCAIVLVGFPNKGGQEYSGSTAWSNQVRSRLFLERLAKDIDPDRLRLSNPKANYSPASEIVFRFHNLSYVLDREVPEDIREAARQTGKASHENATFLKCLDELTKQKRAVSNKSGWSYAPSVMEKLPDALQAGVDKDGLKMAMERLTKIGKIEIGFLWRDTAKGRDVEGFRRVDC